MAAGAPTADRAVRAHRLTVTPKAPAPLAETFAAGIAYAKSSTGCALRVSPVRDDRFEQLALRAVTSTRTFRRNSPVPNKKGGLARLSGYGTEVRSKLIRAQPEPVMMQAALTGFIFAAIAALALMAAPGIAQTTQNVSALPQRAPTIAPLPALEAFASAWNGVTAYRAKVSVFDEKGKDVQNVAFNYTFRKPSSFTVHVIEGPNAGVTLTWDGGPTVQATRGGGLFAKLFKRTLPLHDPLVTTIRGASMDQLSYGAILAHAQQTPGTLAQTPGEPIAGTATEDLLLVPSDPAADAGLES